MGFSISWYAVRNEGAARLLERLGLAATGEKDDGPESLIAAAALDTGWTVLWYGEYDCPFLQTADLAGLSADQDILACQVEEHVMASSAEFWSGGQRVWRLAHVGESGPKGLGIVGEAPESFPAIRAEMEAEQLAAGGEQADVDYLFDIPLLVAKSLVGFKHDVTCRHLPEGGFLVLAQATPKRGFFARLFGR